MSFEIYKADIRKISCEEFRTAYFAMSEKRQKKCMRYIRDEDKKLCIAADFILRKALSEKLHVPEREISFIFTDTGKPLCKDYNIPVSISHSGNFAAAAVGSKNSIGIDIEHIRPVKSAMLRYFCSPSDHSYIGIKEDSTSLITDPGLLEKIFRVWTFKEAYGKCSGEGISLELKQISMTDFDFYSEIFDSYILSVYEK